ncbi:MAG TPA: alpha/beta hydrolase [Prevotella sp.]
MKKKFYITLLALAVLMVVSTFAAGSYLLSYALTNDHIRGDAKNWDVQRFVERHPEAEGWVDSLRTHHALRDTFLYSSPHDTLHVYYIRAAKPTNRVALLVHGYKDRALGMMHIGHMYSGLGYNIVLPDLHGHGASSGNDIQMGWKDRLDVMRTAAVADSLFRGSESATSMVLHGISMGAATVMSVSGEQTPPYMRCFIEDCGYTSAWDEFEGQLAEQFGLPAFPVLHAADRLCKARFGWSFKEASPLKQVGKCRKPMLFIHGDADTYVPYGMVHLLYNAKAAPKDLFIARGSKHARSYEDHREAYTNKVQAFLDRYMGK